MISILNSVFTVVFYMTVEAFTGTATRVARCGLLLEGLMFSYDQVRCTQEFLRGSCRLSVIPYVHGRYLYCCVCGAVQD
jgi:hypothetical protein